MLIRVKIIRDLDMLLIWHNYLGEPWANATKLPVEKAPPEEGRHPLLQSFQAERQIIFYTSVLYIDLRATVDYEIMSIDNILLLNIMAMLC